MKSIKAKWDFFICSWILSIATPIFYVVQLQLDRLHWIRWYGKITYDFAVLGIFFCIVWVVIALIFFLVSALIMRKQKDNIKIAPIVLGTLFCIVPLVFNTYILFIYLGRFIPSHLRANLPLVGTLGSLSGIIGAILYISLLTKWNKHYSNKQ